MKHAKKIGLTIFTICILMIPGKIIIAQPLEIVKWVVEKNSNLRVSGKSNVNSFVCNINGYTKPDTLICTTDPNVKINLSGSLEMDIMSFDCNSSIKTKVLRKTLNADAYPKMCIRFLSLQHMPSFAHKTELITGWVIIELAGVVKRFELSYAFSKTESGYVQLLGGREFRFSEFGLSPPTKMGGMIKIKDEFDVGFRLLLRSL